MNAQANQANQATTNQKGNSKMITQAKKPTNKINALITISALIENHTQAIAQAIVDSKIKTFTKDEAAKVMEAWKGTDSEVKAPALRKRLSRLRAALRANGVSVETDKRGGDRTPKTPANPPKAKESISEQVTKEKAKPANDALTIVKEVRKLAALYSPDIDVDEYLVFQSVIKKLESYLKHDA